MIVGKVYKIYYLIFLKNRKRKKKTCFFVGLCISKKKNFVKIINKFDKEQIIINFDINSPVLLKVVDIKLYKKLGYRKSKLLFKKNKSYFDDINNKNSIIDSSLNSFKRKYYFSAYFKIVSAKRRKKLKKIRRKYFRTLNWLKMKKKYRNIYMYGFENDESEDDESEDDESEDDTLKLENDESENNEFENDESEDDALKLENDELENDGFED